MVDEITTAISDLRAAAETEDVEDMKKKTDALQKAVMKIGEELSRQAGGSGGPEGAEGAGGDQAGQAEDAEYTKADEEKK